MPLHTYTGTVIKAGFLRKTVKVEVIRYTEHKKYLKAIPHRNRFQVHDEHEVSQVGDQVTIIHTGQPISNWKSFRLLEIDRRGRDISEFPEIEAGKAEIFKEVKQSRSEGGGRVLESIRVERSEGIEGSQVETIERTGESKRHSKSSDTGEGSRILDAIEGMGSAIKDAEVRI